VRCRGAGPCAGSLRAGSSWVQGLLRRGPEKALDAAYELLWPNTGTRARALPVLPSLRHFEQASELVTRDAIRDSIVCGNDPAKHREMFETYREAGFDEVYVVNIGPNYRAASTCTARSSCPNPPAK
jgi:hypothetical protein